MEGEIACVVEIAQDHLHHLASERGREGEVLMTHVPVVVFKWAQEPPGKEVSPDVSTR